LKTSPPQSSSPIDYSHHHLVDSFFDAEKGEKFRVTRDEKTGTVLESMKKIRLGDLNVYNPKREADWRVSVNLEVPGSSFHYNPVLEKSRFHLYTQYLTLPVQHCFQEEKTGSAIRMKSSKST
jgi:hypothetical protein